MLVPKTVFRVAWVIALAVEVVVLLPLDPFRLRAPAIAAASAASCTWARATASMPRSIDNARKPHNPMIEIAVRGRIAPRERSGRDGRRIFMGLSLAKNINAKRRQFGNSL